MAFRGDSDGGSLPGIWCIRVVGLLDRARLDQIGRQACQERDLWIRISQFFFIFKVIW